MRRQGGFTLLELLAAVLVFGLMGAMAYRGLIAVVNAEDTLREEARVLRDAASRSIAHRASRRFV